MHRALLPLTLAASACSVDATQLVVVVGTDLRVPAQLDALVIEVEGQGTRFVGPEVRLEGDGAASLPASFGVAPKDGDARRRVSVRVSGLHDGAPVIAARAGTSFIEHRRLRLDLFLAQSCLPLFARCEEQGQTCAQGVCVDPWRDPTGLPRWDEGTNLAPDAAVSLDAAPLPDAAAPADAEVPLDAALPLDASVPLDGAIQRDAAVADDDAGPDAGGPCPPAEPPPGIVGWTADPEGAVATSDVAIDALGVGVVAGTIVGPVSFADGTCADESGIFVSRVPERGQAPWVELLTSPDATFGEPRVTIGPDGSSILVAFDLRDGTVVIEGLEYAGPWVGLLVWLDHDGAILGVIDVRGDEGWEAAALAADASGVALVGTARGRLGDEDAGWDVQLDGNLETAVAVRWDAAMVVASTAPIVADEVTVATAAALYGGGALAVGGTWSGTLQYGGGTPDGFGPHFTVSFDDGGNATWPGPLTSNDDSAEHALSAFSVDGALLLDVAHVGATLNLYILDPDGSTVDMGFPAFDASLHVSDLARSGDAAAVLAGTSDAGGGFIARLDDQLAWSWGPVDLEVGVTALAATPAGDSVLLAGDLVGTAVVDGVDIGAAGLRQVYAVHIAPPP